VFVDDRILAFSFKYLLSVLELIKKQKELLNLHQKLTHGNTIK